MKEGSRVFYIPAGREGTLLRLLKGETAYIHLDGDESSCFTIAPVRSVKHLSDPIQTPNTLQKGDWVYDRIAQIFGTVYSARGIYIRIEFGDGLLKQQAGYTKTVASKRLLKLGGKRK